MLHRAWPGHHHRLHNIQRHRLRQQPAKPPCSSRPSPAIVAAADPGHQSDKVWVWLTIENNTVAYLPLLFLMGFPVSQQWLVKYHENTTRPCSVLYQSVCVCFCVSVFLCFLEEAAHPLCIGFVPLPHHQLGSRGKQSRTLFQPRILYIFTGEWKPANLGCASYCLNISTRYIYNP